MKKLKDNIFNMCQQGYDLAYTCTKWHLILAVILSGYVFIVPDELKSGILLLPFMLLFGAYLFCYRFVALVLFGLCALVFIAELICCLLGRDLRIKWKQALLCVVGVGLNYLFYIGDKYLYAGLY